MTEPLQSLLDQCQVGDIFRFRNRLRKADKIRDKSQKQAVWRSLQQEMEKSIAACERRKASQPQQVSYPKQLPFSEKSGEIARLIKEHQVLVVAGDTGSGKTTQLPKICVEAGLGQRGMIGHTQPRRLAAVSVANRIAEEMAVELGEGVGYQIRFNEKTSPGTFLKIMTDGILLAEIQQDRFLNRYEVIIIDEAHERSLNIDFLLGYMKHLLARRPELKLIITSATIDVEKFSAHFNNAPIVTVSGRTYPVEVRYSPLDELGDKSDSADLQGEAILNAVAEIIAEDKKRKQQSGDILVFLSTERDIRETAQLLRKQRLANTEILPLYGRLRQAEQQRIFKPHQGRRIVLSTNVAETSITVPGINYVIDTGVARISRYSLQSKVQRLPIEAISQASANQRKGRCGRVADGICIRLYSETDFQSRPEFTDPEILRTNLASVILRMQHLKLGDVSEFPFLEPPAPKAVNEGFKLLMELNALNQERKLTAAGRIMAVLPVDPRYARMLVTANTERCLSEISVIVSALSIQDPREVGAENRQQARQAMERFSHPDSDFLELLNIWNDYEKRRQSLSQSQLRKYCKQHFLSFMRMREWREVHRQLVLACQQQGLKLNKEAAGYSAIHKAIISGSLNQIALRAEGRMYEGSRNKKFSLFPGSALANKPTKWIVTGEQIETSQTFATAAAKIQPDWVEEKALHLVKREYFDPHWSQKQQQVMAYEKVSLYGLILIEKKPVPFGNIDPEAARKIFINEALAPGKLQLELPELEKNAEFLEELGREEEKIRRPEHLVSEGDIARFYEQLVPQDVSSTVQFKQWYRQASAKEKQQLLMTPERLLRQDTLESFAADFPDQASAAQNKLTIDYKFEPGKSHDGATIEVPVAILGQLTRADVDWAVPGILREKCIALIKSLPKSLRKNFIPVSGFVDEVLEQMVPGEASFLDALRAQIRRVKKLDIPAGEFDQAGLPAHLKNKVRVIDEAGEELAIGDDLDALRKELEPTLQQAGIADDQARPSLHEIERSGISDWDFPDLPKQLEIGEDLVLVRYPALTDDETSVSIKLFAEQEEAICQHRDGLVRLYMMNTGQQRKMLLKQFKEFARKNALLIPPQANDFEQQATLLCYGQAFDVFDSPARTRDEFLKSLGQGKQQLFQCSTELERMLDTVLQNRHEILVSLKGLEDTNLGYLVKDIRTQLDNLFQPGFISETNWQWLLCYPRFMAAIEARLEKCPHPGPRDQEYTEEIAGFWGKYLDLCDLGHTNRQAEIDLLRWMIEEYRVSLFAQQLGTSRPVSGKRLQKLIDKIKNH
ncbi:MAG: ATP-dependent RNA helicase HrpA [Gammaproteobacteria bacterium]